MTAAAVPWLSSEQTAPELGLATGNGVRRLIHRGVVHAHWVGVVPTGMWLISPPVVPLARRRAPLARQRTVCLFCQGLCPPPPVLSGRRRRLAAA